jgi:hypothetical protein
VIEMWRLQLRFGDRLIAEEVDDIRHPDRAELSGSQQFDQSHSVATVGLDAVATAFRNHRWRNDITNVA